MGLLDVVAGGTGVLPAPLAVVLPTLLHLGALHSWEKVLVAVVAFGPFLVLFAVVHVLRRRDLAAEDDPER